MDEKVNRWPIIALIAASATGLATFSVLQSQQQKEKQQAKFDEAAREQAQTKAVMKKIGQDSLTELQRANDAADAAYHQSWQWKELQRLEAEDRAATALPRSTPPR